MRSDLAVIGLLLAGCSGGGGTTTADVAEVAAQLLPLPDGVPSGTLSISVSDAGRLRTSGKDIAPWPPTQSDLGGAGHAALDKALEGQTGDRVVFQLPVDTSFRDVDPLLRTAASHGMRVQYLPTSDPNRVVGPLTQPSPGGDTSGSVLLGTRPHLVLSVSGRGSFTWVTALVAFEALAQGPDGGAPQGLKDSQLDGLVDCAQVFAQAPELASACAEGQDPNSTPLEDLRLGTSSGCLVQVAETPEDLQTWPTQLSTSLGALDLSAWGTPVVAMDPDLPLGVAVELIGGFGMAGADMPVLASRDGLSTELAPPECPTAAPSPEELALMGAHWLGKASYQAESRRKSREAREARAALAAGAATGDGEIPPYEAEIMELSATGGFDLKQTRTALEAAWPSLDACYRNAARTRTSGGARLEVEVRADGRVQGAQVVASSPGMEGVGACLRGRTQRLTFQSTKEGGTITYEIRVNSL